VNRTVSILCSNLKGNLGDFAIAEAIAASASRYLGACDVHLFYHANKEVDQVRLKVLLEESDFSFKSIRAAPYFRRPSWLRTFCRLGLSDGHYSKQHNLQIPKVARRIQQEEDFFETVSGSDLILFAGGAQWGRGDLNLNMFAQLQAVAVRSCPVRAFPFSISQATIDCNGSDALSSLFAPLSRPVLVRDGISNDCLHAVGVGAELVSDGVFSLSGTFQSKWKGVEAAGGQSGKVYVSLTQSGDTGVASVLALLKSLEESSLTPVLFSSCEVEDRPFYERIQKLCSVEALYPASWKQAVEAISSCRFVITNRLHCLIFSALSGTPVVPVTNRSKSRAYVKDADLPYSLENVGPIKSSVIEGYTENLAVISGKQIVYAKACTEILNRRLPALFELGTTKP